MTSSQLTSRISNTAHYTGYTWVKAGLAPAQWATRRGRVFHAALEPAARVLSPWIGGMTLERMLLDRHALIDRLLFDAIATRGVRTVVEIAAGLSARGLRTLERYGSVRYVDLDLPAMVSRRKSLHAASGARVLPEIDAVDALAASGPLALSSVLERLRVEGPVVFVVEGLLNYFSPEQAQSVIAGCARAARARGGGLITDGHFSAEVGHYAVTRAFVAGLGLFARGRVGIHFTDSAACVAAYQEAGFAEVAVHRPGDVAPSFVVAIQAWTGSGDVG